MADKREQYRNTIPLGEMRIPLQQTLDRLNLRVEDLRGKTIVDIGGGIYRAFGEQVFQSLGTTVYTVEPRAASDGRQSSEAPIIAGEAQKLPIKSNSVDLVVSYAIMPMWLPTKDDIKSAFDEVDRILKPGGEGLFYPPFHMVFTEDLKRGAISLPEEVLTESAGTQTSHATLIGLQNLGVNNLELRKRQNWDFEMIFHKELLVYKKPENKSADLVQIPDLRPQHVVECRDANTGGAFFSPLEGETATGLRALRLRDHDVIVVNLGDDKAAAIVARSGSFIAVESHTSDPQNRGNLAFRDDNSHRRLNLAFSVTAGQDVTYQDDRFVQGETTRVNQEDEFVEVALREDRTVRSIRPSWYTEDWVTVGFENNDSLVIRADRNSIQGGILLTPDGTSLMNIGDNTLEASSLAELPIATPLPSRLELPE